MADTQLPVVVVVPGDLHLTAADADNYRAAEQVVAEVGRLVRPDFVQFIGDNVQDGTAEQFALFRDLAGRLPVPWYALVGDHDAQGDVTAARHREHVGPPTGSLCLRGFRFVRLNTQEGKPVGLSAGQVAWLRAEADAAAVAGERLVMFQHNYPYQVWEDFAGPGIDGWREVVQTRRVEAILCGHTHYWQRANDGRNAVVAVRSIGDPEGGRPGYAVAYFHGDDFAVVYRTLDDLGPLVMVTRPRETILATGPAHVVGVGGEVRVHVWAERAVGPVEARVGDGAWFPLSAARDGEWAAPLPAEGLTKGVHRLTVRAADGAGAVAAREVEYAADPTGRYTAVPRVDPWVAETNFC